MNGLARGSLERSGTESNQKLTILEDMTLEDMTLEDMTLEDMTR
jgi:hypothetical protein